MSVFRNLTVIELGRVFSGPFCGMILGDTGLRVIKIEKPGTGDESRQFGEQISDNQSCYFNSLNRNKESVVLDLKNDDDKKVLLNLLKTADVLVHNWIQGSLDKLGFSYEHIKVLNPKLIYCSISGFGLRSPYKNDPAQDIIAQSLSGLQSLTGDENGDPLKTGIPIVDYSSGLYASYAIMSALYMREKTNKGQFVDTSLLETALAMTSFASSVYMSKGIMKKRMGNSHPLICPYNVYKTTDGFVSIAVANNNMWNNFCKALNLKIANDIKFITNNNRIDNRKKLDKIISKAIRRYSTDGVCKVLKANKVSCSQVFDLKQALNSEEVKSLKMEIECGPDGAYKFIGSPFHMSENINTDFTSPPVLGEHTDKIKNQILKNLS